MITTTPEPAYPPVIDYARPVGGLDPRRAAVARAMVPVAVLSGPCVAVCFAALAWGPVGAAMHLAVFAATIGFAVRAGARSGGAVGKRGSLVAALDVVAGVGLLGIALAPVYWGGGGPEGHPRGVALGTSYALLAVAAPRHLFVYWALSDWAVDAGRVYSARSLAALGYVKMLFEGLWLGTCALCVLLVSARAGGDFAVGLAFAALGGCFVYGVIWVWMMIAHVRLARTGP